MAIVHKKDTKFEFVYFVDAVVYYASVFEPKKKYQSDERQYEMTVFISPEDAKKAKIPVSKGGLFINKNFAKVDVDVNKYEDIKYSSEKYPGTEGLVGVSLTSPEFTKQGKPRTIKVIDKDGKDFDQLIGNGSKCTIKCWGWRKSAEDKLNITLELVQVKEHVPYEGAGAGAVVDDVLGVSYEVATQAKPEAKESVMDFDDSDVPFEVDSDDDLY